MSAPAADLLSDMLVGLQLKTGVLCLFDLTAPWGFNCPAFGPALIYAVIEGEAYVEVDGAPPIWAREGDIFLMPATADAVVRSSPDAPAPLVDELFREGQELWEAGKRMDAPIVTEAGGGGACTQLLVVLLEFAEPDRNPLGLHLPRLIHLRREDHTIVPWLAPAVRAIVEETSVGRLGYFAVSTRLAELVFINAIRTHLILRPEDSSGWLRGMSDPRIARTLAAMHRRADERWTVAGLADFAGMSRSAFAERFRALVGESPFDYLTSWRMRLARDRLSQGRTVKATAQSLGYASEKAFSHAFRRMIGVPPSHFRLRARNEGAR